PGGRIAVRLADEELTLEPGDLMVQLTDGYTEAMEPRTGEQLGFDRIEALVKEQGRNGPRRIAAALADAVRKWTGCESPGDDETLLVISRTARVDTRPATDGKSAHAATARTPVTAAETRRGETEPQEPEV